MELPFLSFTLEPSGGEMGVNKEMKMASQRACLLSSLFACCLWTLSLQVAPAPPGTCSQSLAGLSLFLGLRVMCNLQVAGFFRWFPEALHTAPGGGARVGPVTLCTL